MPIEISREDGLLTVTMNRPDVLNALNSDMRRELSLALHAAATDTKIRAVVLTGAGRGFCAGADLRGTPPVDAPNDLRYQYHPLIGYLAGFPKPVVAAVNGVAAGAGLGLCAAADARVGSDAARFVPAFLRLGLVPDCGLTHTLPRLVGADRALRWLATNDRLGAEEAAAWGLLDAVVSAEDLLPEAKDLAQRMAAADPEAFRRTKWLLRQGARGSLAEQLESEMFQQEDLRNNPTFQSARAGEGA